LVLPWKVTMSDEKGEEKTYSHWFVVVTALFVTSLITANIMSVKLIGVRGWVLPAGILIFPVSYIIGDILTEVYGYTRARQVIWLGFFCNFTVVLALWLGKIAPVAPFWEGQRAYEEIFGFTPRLVTASFMAYLVGEFLNAFIMARLKIATKGRLLWTRTIGSTLVGQGLDSLIFISLAFGGILPPAVLASAILTQWIAKSAYEAAATPLTYVAVRFLKKREKLDIFDYGTRYNPFLVGK
jgi:queuosine precursor transporter